MIKLLKNLLGKFIVVFAEIEKGFDKRCKDLKEDGHDIGSLINREPGA